MMEWKEVRLGDIATFSQGKQVPVELQFKSYKIGLQRFIRIVDYTSNWQEPIRYVECDSKYHVDEDDIIMIRYGSQTCGKVFRGGCGVIANNMFKVNITVNTISKDYLFWFLKQNSVYKQLIGAQSSSTMPALTFGMMKNIVVKIPSLSAQRRIASILSSLDDKIAVNRRICENLEAQAQALFKNWFVDFAPFKNGKFVESELGMIPEGWRVGTLGEIAEFKRGKTITKGDTKEGNIPVVAGGLEPAYYHDQANTSSRVITISASGANAGYTRMYYLPVWASDCSYVDCKSTSFLHTTYCYLLTNKKKVDALQWGAAQPHVYAKDVNKLPFAIPPTDVLTRFEELVTDVFDCIELNNKESSRLSALRDTLLPKLMSGEIKV